MEVYAKMWISRRLKDTEGLSMKKIVEKIENFEFSTREFLFVSLILFLMGLLLGIIISPKGERTIGCNNGNNNTGCLTEESNSTCSTD